MRVHFGGKEGKKEWCLINYLGGNQIRLQSDVQSIIIEGKCDEKMGYINGDASMQQSGRT